MREFDHADSKLNRLAGCTEQADPFSCRTEWIFSCHEAFNPSRELFFRETAGSLIAFAGYPHPEVGYILEPLEAYWCFSAPLLGQAPVQLLAALLEEEAFRHRLPFVLVSGLLPHDRLLFRLFSCFRDRFDIARLDPSVFRSASLEGGVDGFLSRRSRKLRQNIRRSRNKLTEAGILFERCVPHTSEESDFLYDRMLKVEETSWKGLGKCGMTMEPSRLFYRLMLRRMAASGMGRVIFAVNDGRDVGFIFGGITGENYRGQQFSYAEEWESLSLGGLLQMEKIAWLCEEGVTRYDMGQFLQYKLHWTEMELRTETLLLRPKNLS